MQAREILQQFQCVDVYALFDKCCTPVASKAHNLSFMSAMPPKAEIFCPRGVKLSLRDYCYRITYVLGVPRPASYADFLSDCRSVFLIHGICAARSCGNLPYIASSRSFSSISSSDIPADRSE